MSEVEVRQIKQDLEVINQALGFERLFGWADVWLSITMLGVGITLAILGTLGISVPGFPFTARMSAFGIIMLHWVILSLWLRGRRAKHPASWREARIGLIAVPLVIISLGLFMYWSIRQGLSLSSIASGIIFAGGLAILLIGICDRNRLHYLGAAIPMMILGPAFPAIAIGPHGIDQHGVDIFIGLYMASVGGLMAAIMAWQLRRKSDA